MRSVPPAAAALAAGLALLAPAPTADARRVAVTQPSGQFAQGPTLVGDRIAWAEEGCRRGCDPMADVYPDRYRVYWARSGRRERLARADNLRTRFGDETSTEEGVSFGTSSNRVALLRSRFDRSPGEVLRESTGLHLGFLGQPREPVFSCAASELGLTGADRPPLDMDDATLAYDAARCGRPSRLAVRDLASDTTRFAAQPADSFLELIRTSGRYVAVLRRLPSVETREIAVYRSDTLAEVYRARTPTGLAAEDIDVQDDGTVALVARGPTDECDEGVLSWYSVAQPTEHRLATKPCPHGVRIARGRAVVFVETDEDGGQELRSAGLGGETQPLVRLGRGARRVEHPLFKVSAGPTPFFDFDGDRIAYALRDCSGNQGLHLTGVGGQPDRVRYVGCPLRLRSTRIAGPSRRRLSLAVRCPRGCSGTATIRRGHVRLAYTGYFALGAGRRQRIRLIDEAASRAFRGRRAVRVRIAIRAVDRAGRDQRPLIRRGVLLGR
ncbi:MAG: hypothetical protein M3350_08060 [Actinomycetota bacterium]|nr:hypothetical protein [Actinomycetota bacterium]MDQ3720715.1 hypothetical protein [Actinomycetota bacterium]